MCIHYLVHRKTTLLKKYINPLLVIISIAIMIVLRLYALNSDAYPRLSWSSALLTDEGFYLHNARNVVLYGHARTDGFNNMMIMPFLHYLQVVWFQMFGVGAYQARILSVLFSLLSLPIFYAAMNRAFGKEAAGWGALLLGLDHIYLLYNRLALMDTPGAAILIIGWYFWVLGLEVENSEGNGAKWWLLSGLFFGLVYGVRGLGALVWLAPIALMIWKRRFRGLSWFIAGLGGVLLFYIIWWWIPNRIELAHMNEYYIRSQLLPHSLKQFWHNETEACWNWERGLLPYLFKHSPVQLIPAGAIIVLLIRAMLLKYEKKQIYLNSIQFENRVFLSIWMIIFCLFFAFVNYSPSRYYVLFYPAMSGLAGDAWACWSKKERYGKWAITILFSSWLIINSYWLIDWISHLTYYQRDADQWLGRHLPSNAVVFGAVAPGLCMDNHLLPINVIADLCNDHHPLEKFASRPRYIVMLDAYGNDKRWRERWWLLHYPQLIIPERRIHLFHPILRPFFAVGVYSVPKEFGLNSGKQSSFVLFSRVYAGTGNHTHTHHHR